MGIHRFSYFEMSSLLTKFILIFINWYFFFYISLWQVRVFFFTKIRSDQKSRSLGFFVNKRNAVSKKGLFLIHFHSNDPQYQQYFGERITWLLTVSQVYTWSFIAFSVIKWRHKNSNSKITRTFTLLSPFSIITLMIIKNRVLWLGRSSALFCCYHRAVIITLKASSFQNGSEIFWCFGVGNWWIILFSR